MKAGGNPEKSLALDGAMNVGRAFASVMSMPGMYQCRKASMTSPSRIGASAFSVNDGNDRSAVMVGYQSS